MAVLVVAGTFTSVDFSPESLFIAVVGAAATIYATVITRRGNRDVAQLQAAQADQNAYTRASSIDAGVQTRLEAENNRLVRENTRLIQERDADRVRWAEEKAELREEAERLEARIRELLDEVVALRARHDNQGVPDPRPHGSG